MLDRFNRKIDYLRISVTDRCNLRCVYCMPEKGIISKGQDEILSFEQIHTIVKSAVGLGINKIRITGGEPLVRKGLPVLIASLKSIGGLKEVCLTTNGVYLSEYARILKKSGLDRINISLDSLIPDRFKEITRGGDLEKVLKGIDRALMAGFASLKINMVLLKNFNIDEIPGFAALAKHKPINVRFIEYMATGPHGFRKDELKINNCAYGDIFFSAQEAKDICSKIGELIPVRSDTPAAARTFRIKGSKGTVGFICAISAPFCGSCNKLRLTADGLLRNCLHSGKTIDLKKLLNGQDDALARIIQEAVYLKPLSHNLSDPRLQEEGVKLPRLGKNAENFSMCQIGG